VTPDVLRELNLNQLVALDALLQESNVTRAAARLGLTQSAMSHTLRQLRAHFGDQLLVRGQRGMQPTPRAQQLQVPLRRVLQALELLLKGELVFDPERSSRTFHLAMGDAVILSLMPGLLTTLRTQAPGVDLRMRPIFGNNVYTQLETGELDLVLTVGAPGEPGLLQRRLFRDSFVCLVREGHPDVKETLDLETFVRLPHLLISPQGEGPSQVDEALARLNLKRRVMLRLPSFTVAPIIAASSDLLLTAPLRMALAMKQHYPLRLVRPPVELPDFDMIMVWHERFDDDPAHRWLRGLVLELTREMDAPRLAPRT
jgi:DNA-binding transcriptional LysR family regulator